MMVVFTLFFGRLAGSRRPTGVPVSGLRASPALVPWTFFANALAGGGNSLVGNSDLITKVYFPRLLMPIAAVALGPARLRDRASRAARA